MNVMWVLLCVALTGVQLGYGLPLGTPHTYPQDEGNQGSTMFEGWNSESVLYAGVPALALVLAAVGLIFGCTWCYRHKDCKLFTASVSQLHDASRRAQPDSGFSEPVNNNISEDNNNGPISLREMQNIANNNAAAYIVSENEERNRISRESVVEFEPLPEIGVPDPLERYADWFGNEDFPRDRLQYLREIGRGWFGRIVQGEVESDEPSSVAVKILNQDAIAEDRARFLDEARMYRDLRHENLLAFLAKCLQEEPWILVFELCQTDLQQYLIANRPRMSALVESGAPLRLVCDVTSALSYLHERGFVYGDLTASSVLVRGEGEAARAVLGRYGDAESHAHTPDDDVRSLGVVLWQVWSWGAEPAPPPLPEPTAPCPYRPHVYQVMQLCWSARPPAAAVLSLLQSLRAAPSPSPAAFEERWQRLKPNDIPVLDEHVALVHAPRPRHSDSLTNLHGSLEDVADIYLTHNEAASLDCHQAPAPDAVDPWLKDLLAGSQDDVSYYRDVSDVIKNLDNILNSEKTSSSESSHQASPSRDNLSLDCKREFSVQSSLVKSPGIRNFQNLESDFDNEEGCVEDEVDRDTLGTLSHSFGRHSDTTSQHTLANLTPDTPNRDFELVCEEAAAQPDSVEMPKDNVVSNADVCLDVSEDIESEVTEDCQTCDIVEAKTYHLSLEPLVTKSVEEITSEKETDRSSAGVTEIPLEETKLDSQGNVVIDMENFDETVSSELPLVTQSDSQTPVPMESRFNNIRSLTEDFLLDQVNHASKQIEDRINENVPREVESKIAEESQVDEINHNERLIDVIHESEMIVNAVITAAAEALTPKKIEETCSNGVDYELDEAPPILVQTFQSEENSPNKDESTLVETINEVTDLKESNGSHSSIPNPNIHLSPSRFRDDDVTDVSESIEDRSDTASTLPIGSAPDIVQNTTQPIDSIDENRTIVPSNRIENESTVYMDLINTTALEIYKNDTMSNTLKEVINTCLDQAPENEPACPALVRGDSTVYMDLPSLLNDTVSFLQSERAAHCQHIAYCDFTSSTPKNDDEKDQKPEKCEDGCRTPDYGPAFTHTKLDQRNVPENISPFDSPTRSHPTETYDENSSIVLGPFENCSLELFKTPKSVPADIELPKEELLAFSSNFSEMNLATPSPLRDVNFLNEVPDVDVTEPKDESVTDTEQKKQLDFCESEQANKPEHGPSTPPNSPGNFLASSQKYVETTEKPEPEAGVSSLHEEIDINQIELQITSKLAMAENENNLNIEYSVAGEGEGEEVLAGGGDGWGSLALDDDCMRALRDELELKLPLAQVASIEPAEELESPEPCAETEPGDGEGWRGAGTVVSYLGALSPIAEETGGQLSAYDNDVAWNTSTRTDSSSCQDGGSLSSDAEPPPPSSPRTYTVRSPHTYTVQDAPTRVITDMSADSLNSSPDKVAQRPPSPVDDRTYIMDDKVNCEMISQVSPFLLSPSDTSAPEDTDNATGASTSKTTAPTDAKASKNSETQCLSKATSIDSWCSNDTLFNVEEDFDDLAEVQLDFDNKDDDNSDSTHTLNDKENSHCSTYIVHDDGDKSECDSFTPDSITANQTYTKPKVDETPIVVLTSEVNDSSPVNTQTRDLAYGTLTGLTSCTTDLVSINDELWRLPQPELVRRSPMGEDINLTPPKDQAKNCDKEPSPKLGHTPEIKKMESVEITCLEDYVHNNNISEPLVAIEETSNDSPVANEKSPVDTEKSPVATEQSPVATEQSQVAHAPLVVANDSPDMHYRNMAHSMQSTPLMEVVDENSEVEGTSLVLPQADGSAGSPFINVPNFQMFINSAELRPQDISPLQTQENITSQDTGLLLESESKFSQSTALDRTPNYASFEESAMFKPQEINSRSSHELSAVSSNEDFRLFENSVRSRPQDLSATEATSILLMSEIKSSELAMGNSTNAEFDHTSQNYSAQNGFSGHDFEESRVLGHHDFNLESELDENEQPHSIIFTESPLTPANRTFDSHENAEERTFESHTHRNHHYNSDTDRQNDTRESPQVNGDMYRNTNDGEPNARDQPDEKSPKNDTESPKESPKSPTEESSPVDNVLISRELVSLSESVQSPKDILSPSEDVQSAKETSVEVSSTEVQLPNGSHVDSPQCNGAYFATLNFVNENFEELLESNVDSNSEVPPSPKEEMKPNNVEPQTPVSQQNGHASEGSKQNGVKEDKSATESFLANEKIFCQNDAFPIPLLGDIRFTGPASEIMSTSFSQESPTEPTAAPATSADLMKDWDTDSDDSHDSNSSSGEFIWKDGDGHETPVVPSYYDHHRDAGGGAGGAGSGDASGSSGSGSEGDEVEFVPSSWDCRAAPAKSSLRSLDQPIIGQSEGKKRVVFKRQKYHCVYEYPREAADDAPRHAEYCTYAEWDAAAAAAAEAGYRQLYGLPDALRAPVAAAADYDDDFFISSSARPFESLGLVSSQFFPGLHALKAGELDPSPLYPPADDPPPPAPLTPQPLDLTTPDSGVEDITPGSTSEFEKKIPEGLSSTCWRAGDGGGSPESPGGGGAGGELGGLRHTRDRLKLDLPPSPHLPSPRQGKVFSFTLDKPRPRHDATPLVMTDDTPLAAAIPLPEDINIQDIVIPEPTFSTFGKSVGRAESEPKMILDEEATESGGGGGAGGGTALDSGDEDSGIESSAKASLERKQPPVA